MNIYVGNLSPELTERELRLEFSPFGQVVSITLIEGKYIGSGQSMGHGFIEMPSPIEGQAAITALNGKNLKQTTIKVIEALPLSNRGSNHGRKGTLVKSRVNARRF